MQSQIEILHKIKYEFLIFKCIFVMNSFTSMSLNLKGQICVICMSRPNVCADQEMYMMGGRQPCVQAFSRMVKVWKQGCTSHKWCVGYERRTAYYTTYRQVYNMDLHTVYKCCPGWTQKNDEMGCLHICSENTCFNGGRCAETGDHVCHCPLGFKGTRCQYGEFSFLVTVCLVVPSDVDECEELNGGCQQTCVNTRGSYHCECSEGFRMHTDGRTCIVRDPCGERNGGCAQLCLSEEGRVHCSCRPGFKLAGDGKDCEDIDECSSGHAKCSHGCVNMPGSFSCLCHPGFELGSDGKQCYRIEMEIVNSCEKNNGGCSHHCEHTTNGPLCSCYQGYHLEQDRKTCVDSNECVSGESCCSHVCRNYPGGYECSCRAGYRLHPDGCGCDEEEVEEEEEQLEVDRLPDLLYRKAPQLLQYTAALRSRYGSDNDDGSHGGDSEREIEIQRERRGELRLDSHIVCLDGSFGEDCSMSCKDCVHGACGESKDRCDCSPGWTGTICSESKETDSKGYFGWNCRRKCSCPNNGPCHRLYGACLCSPGLYGRFCHLRKLKHRYRFSDRSNVFNAGMGLNKCTL
uniref:Zgc:158328 n=1 Tax=Salarias fasciatus TaxID=181472 RepID=A0A672J0E1_SALFA